MICKERVNNNCHEKERMKEYRKGKKGLRMEIKFEKVKEKFAI